MLSICRVEFGAYDVPRLSALCHGCERHHRRWGSVIADRLVEADQSISPRRNLLSRDQLHSDRIAHTLDFGRSFSCDLRHCCCLGCRRSSECCQWPCHYDDRRHCLHRCRSRHLHFRSHFVQRRQFLPQFVDSAAFPLGGVDVVLGAFVAKFFHGRAQLRPAWLVWRHMVHRSGQRPPSFGGNRVRCHLVDLSSFGCHPRLSTILVRTGVLVLRRLLVPLPRSLCRDRARRIGMHGACLRLRRDTFSLAPRCAVSCRAGNCCRRAAVGLRRISQ